MNYFKTKIESQYPKNDYRSCNYSGDWTRHFINDYVDRLFSDGLVQTQSSLSEYKDEHLPKNLYKFYPPSIYSLINLEKNSVYLSSPRCFNDPFDSFMCIEAETFKKLYLLKKLKELNLVSKDQVVDKISESEYYEIFYSWTKDENPPLKWNGSPTKYFTFVLFDIRQIKSKKLSDLIYNIVEDARIECRAKIDNLRNMEFRISCFSNFKDDSELLKNTTMWSHYADNHRGFCVKYKLDFQNVINKDAIRCGLYPIKYTSKVPQVSPRELMKLKFKNNELELNNAVHKTALKTLITKSRSWSYEKEWRLILSSHDSDLLTNNAVQFVAVESIFLGCRVDASLKKHLVSFAEQNKIKIYETKQNNERFELNISELYVGELRKSEYNLKENKIAQIDNIIDRNLKMKRLFDSRK